VRVDVGSLGSDLAIGLAGAAIAHCIERFFQMRRSAREEEIWRIVRYLKQDLDKLELLSLAQQGSSEELHELRSNIRAYGEEAHEIDGRRGMDSLLRKVAELDLSKATFYETKVDKIWDFIGFENGKFSRRGVWVA
jgi:hypothetical protein